MSDDIKVGDLVMVINPAKCGCLHKLGITFSVSKLVRGKAFECAACGCVWESSRFGVMGYSDYAFDLARLKKIDPPAIGDTLPTRAELPIKELA